MIRILCVTLGAMLISSSAQAQSALPTAWAFVLFGEGTGGRPVPMVRSVEEGGATCPVLRDAGGTALATMSPRRRPAGGHFDQVLVCEALYPVGRSASVQFASRRVDLPVVSLGTPIKRALPVSAAGRARHLLRIAALGEHETVCDSIKYRPSFTNAPNGKRCIIPAGEKMIRQ